MQGVGFLEMRGELSTGGREPLGEFPRIQQCSLSTVLCATIKQRTRIYPRFRFLHHTGPDDVFSLTVKCVTARTTFLSRWFRALIGLALTGLALMVLLSLLLGLAVKRTLLLA